MKVLSCVIFLAVLVVGTFAQMFTEYYDILGLKSDCNERQIKKAFRKLSLKYHPDKNQGDEEAKVMFQKISEAYEVISDPEKRGIYDVDGPKGLEKLAKGGNQPASPFDMFFGGGGGGKQKGQDAHVDIQVSLEDLYNGGVRSTRIKRNVLCPKCRGTGAKDGQTKKCRACNGQGVRLVQQQMGPGFTVQMQQTCDKCGGKGYVSKAACPKCRGSKVVMEDKLLTADIEKGMPSTHEIKFERESEQRPGIVPGDVIFKLRQQEHSRFRREGNDLHHTMSISLAEALLGFSRTVKQLDNRQVLVENEGVTRPFQVLRVVEEGMPHHNFPSQRGDLHVKVNVQFPSYLNDQQKNTIKELFKE